MARNVTLESNSGTDNERWDIIPCKGYYILVNKSTGEAMELVGEQAANGTNIQTNTQNENDNQLFNVTLVSHDLAYYHIISPKLDGNKLLTAVGDGITDNNINIQDNTHNSLQKFWLRKETDGYYMIFHSFTGKAISA